VATVVCKLFNQVQPDVAVFGEKDFQQLMVIRRMAADLDSPVEILSEPTVREADGLALSSRNRYLSAVERAAAPALQRVLRSTADALHAGRRDYAALETEASQLLAVAGFMTDYVSIRRSADLEVPADDDRHLVVLAAAVLGRARLIDNIQLTLQPG
jgi:pantoate--beta-alanine ligase